MIGLWLFVGMKELNFGFIQCDKKLLFTQTHQILICWQLFDGDNGLTVVDNIDVQWLFKNQVVFLKKLCNTIIDCTALEHWILSLFQMQSNNSRKSPPPYLLESSIGSSKAEVTEFGVVWPGKSVSFFYMGSKWSDISHNTSSDRILPFPQWSPLPTCDHHCAIVMRVVLFEGTQLY